MSVMERIEVLKERFEGEILENADLRNYSFMHTGGHAKYLFEPYSIADLELISEQFGEVKCIGNGSNVLFRGDIDKIVVISRTFNDSVSIEGDTIRSSAGVSLPVLAKKAYENSLTGFEELVGIPGSVGGAIRMNAGAFGKTVFDVLTEFSIFETNSGRTVKMSPSDVNVQYRNGGLQEGQIVVSGTFKLNRGEKGAILNKMFNFSANRRMKQPMKGYSLGSIFKNPKKYPAGWLIEECGFKGTKIGGAYVSEKHANFIINDGSATSEDVLQLIDMIRTQVFKRFNIELELEIVVL